MSRIFTTLATFATALVVVTLLWGLYIGDLHDPSLRDHPEKLAAIVRLAIIHKMLGLASALVVVLVNSIVVTYFIGVGRWCKEVVETYALDRRLLRCSAILKRRTFPWAVCCMLAIVGVIALGAAADPGRPNPGTENWVYPHLIGALVGLGFVFATFFVEAQRIREHQAVISDILAEVRRIRLERGLDVDG